MCMCGPTMYCACAVRRARDVEHAWSSGSPARHAIASVGSLACRWHGSPRLRLYLLRLRSVLFSLFSQVLAPALWPLSRFFDSNSSAGAFGNIIWAAPKEPSWLLCSGAATKDFLMGRKSFILEVWAAPGALESLPKDRWLSPYFLQGIPGLRCRPDPRNDRFPTLSKIFHPKLTRRPACVHISYTLASR